MFNANKVLRKVFISAGLGDWFAISNHLTQQQIDGIELAYLATPAAKFIQEIVPFPTKVLAEKAFDDLEHFEEVYGPLDAEDLSFSTLFWNNKETLPTYGFDFSKIKNARFSDEDYTVVIPTSVNKFPGREFSIQEIELIAKYVPNPVALYHQPLSLPFPSVVTDLKSAIGILMGAIGCITIDSSLACLACQLFDDNHLMIKTSCAYYLKYKQYYCAPKKTFNFVADARRYDYSFEFRLSKYLKVVQMNSSMS